MQFAFLENRHEARAFAYSLGVILLSVLAVAAFILFGGGTVFYALAALAIAVGFYMAYHLSRTPAAGAEQARAPRARARTRKR